MNGGHTPCVCGIFERLNSIGSPISLVLMYCAVMSQKFTELHYYDTPMPVKPWVITGIQAIVLCQRYNMLSSVLRQQKVANENRTNL